MFNITILSDAKSWINKYIADFKIALEQKGYTVHCTHFPEEIKEGEIAFLLGCYTIIKKQVLEKNKHNLVVHASDLPKGRGWAPLAWQILENKNIIPVCLFEAEESMDTGDIYIKDYLEFNGTELCNEIREKQALNTIKLCLSFLDNYPEILQKAQKQVGTPTFYERRTAKSSQLDINKTIKEQFNLLRIADNQDYPAYFEINDTKYLLKIEKAQ